MNLTQTKERVREIQQITGLRPTHFADLIRKDGSFDSQYSEITSSV